RCGGPSTGCGWPTGSRSASVSSSAIPSTRSGWARPPSSRSAGSRRADRGDGRGAHPELHRTWMGRRTSNIPRGSQGPSSTFAWFEVTLFISRTRILYVGSIIATKQHAHHAAQIVIAPSGLHIEDGAGGRIRACAAVIPPRLAHRHGDCTHAAFLFLD